MAQAMQGPRGGRFLTAPMQKFKLALPILPFGQKLAHLPTLVGGGSLAQCGNILRLKVSKGLVVMAEACSANGIITGGSASA